MLVYEALGVVPLLRYAVMLVVPLLRDGVVQLLLQCAALCGGMDSLLDGMGD